MSTSVDRKLGTVMGKQDQAQRDAEAAAAEAARKQEEAIAEQKKKEALRLAEADSEVGIKRARALKAGGRSLLIKTSAKGVQNLGGS